MQVNISIITASYNCCRYLPDCIKSVQAQQFDDYEHLILNDCSTDKSKKILNKLASKDRHIRIIHADKRSKCGSSYFRLSHEAKGDIIGVLDADDALAPKSMRTLLDYYDKYPDIDFIWTQFWLCDANLHKIKRGFSSHPGDYSLLESGMKGKHNFSHWRTFRKRVLDKGDIFPVGLSAAVDKYMGYSLEELGKGAFLNIPLYYYRQRVGGLSFTGRKIWKSMKKDFSDRRAKNNVSPFPIIKID